MKKIFDHIEHIKSQPHHVRKSIAFGTAMICTVFVALVWLVGNLRAGTFALQVNSPNAGENEGVTVIGNQNVAGVGAAEAFSDESAPRIEIIDAVPKIRKEKQVEQTTIPF